MAVSLIGDLIAPYALITSRQRMIGSIIPDAVIEESHHDELRVTDHPVETGAAITDHSFKIPPELDMRIAFSNSSAGYEGYVQQIYDELIKLQEQRQPFAVTTGKRAYKDMLLISVSQTTDVRSEYALMIVCRLKQIKWADTQPSTSAGPDAQSDPQKTSPVAERGTQQTNLADQLAAGVVPDPIISAPSG